MNSFSSILIIYTGGTIGMIKDAKTGVLKPFDMDNLLTYIPLLKNIDCQLTAVSFNPPLDSSNMTPSVWIKLVKIIEENYDKYDGFVILHGSDTMAYTASALSFLLENLGKPVILTGSQLPIGLLRTDGRENLIVAIEIASAKSEGKPLVPEVCIYFENHLYRGNRSHKYNADNFNAFISANYPPLAEIGVHIRYNFLAIRKPMIDFLIPHYNLEENIAVLKLFPGIAQKNVEAILSIDGLKAVVLETYGAGNAPTDKWFLDALKKAIRKEILIFNVSQCKAGAVELGKYETSENLKKIGVVGGGDITIEAAITKLMYLFGEKFSKDKVEKLLPISLRGEITE